MSEQSPAIQMASPQAKNLFQRLQELKVWQETHESLLRDQQLVLDKSELDVTTASDYKTIEGLSAFDTTCTPSKQVFDIESPIKPTSKSFEELIEENLSKFNDSSRNKSVEKKPFLRKGSGLQRFQPNPKPRRARRKGSDNSFTPLRSPPGAIENKAVWSKVNETPAQNRTLNQSVPPSEQSLYERALEKELLIFEALEEKTDNGSFCSTNSSVLNILNSSPKKNQPMPKNQLMSREEKHVHWESGEDVIRSKLEERDLLSIFTRLTQMATTSKSNSTLPSSEYDSYDEDEKSSTTSSSATSSIFCSDKEVKDVAVSTASISEMKSTTDKSPPERVEKAVDTTECADTLHKKIIEYDQKIKNVIEERDKIQKTRRQLELREKELSKRITQFEDKERDFLMEMDNDRKRLAKEKSEFQAYVKEIQSAPTRKDRDEVSKLKREVAELRESLKLRESKNGMSQARLRNQVKQLEKENCNLKLEVEKLTKENAKLIASQKLNPRRTKKESNILRENNNLTRSLSMDNDVERASPKNNRDLSLLELYKSLTPSHDVDLLSQNVSSNSLNDSNRIEQVLVDGSKEIKYSNGNLKTISADGNFITMKYFNGDIKQTFLLDGVVKYYFHDRKIWQTTYPNGEELIEFADGVKEKRFKDGKCEVTLHDDVVQTITPDGTQQIQYPDGSILTIKNDGEKVLLLPNGQVEIETDDHRRREYPDGTVKILYKDGKQETRYCNGRIRIRDENGTLILDNHKDS